MFGSGIDRRFKRDNVNLSLFKRLEQVEHVCRRLNVQRWIVEREALLC